MLLSIPYSYSISAGRIYKAEAKTWLLILFEEIRIGNIESLELAISNIELRIDEWLYTVSEHQYDTSSREEKRFLYFNHLSKEFLEQMIPHLKALV